MKKIKPSQLGPTLKGLSELAGDDFATILQKLTLDGFRMLVRRSAQDTGFLRSNWDVEIDTTPPSTELKHPTPGKGTFAPPVPDTAKQIEAGSKVTLYNNTEYAQYLEDGTPRMRAQPMVEPTRQALERQAIRLSKALSKKVYDV